MAFVKFGLENPALRFSSGIKTIVNLEGFLSKIRGMRVSFFNAIEDHRGNFLGRQKIIGKKSKLSLVLAFNPSVTSILECNPHHCWVFCLNVPDVDFWVS